MFTRNVCLFVCPAGKLYVIGGSDGHMSLNSVDVFDPCTQTWSFGPSMSVARTNVGVAVTQNRLFAVGGFSGKEFLDSLEYLTEDGCEWCSSLPVTNYCNGDERSNGGAMDTEAMSTADDRISVSFV